MQILAVFCHRMIPLVVKSILIQARFTINYTEEFLVVVQWIAALIAEICFITCVMLQQKLSNFCMILAHSSKVKIEFSKRWQNLLESQPMTVWVLKYVMFDYIAFICKQNSFKILFNYVSVFICKGNALRLRRLGSLFIP